MSTSSLRKRLPNLIEVVGEADLILSGVGRILDYLSRLKLNFQQFTKQRSLNLLRNIRDLIFNRRSLIAAQRPLELPANAVHQIQLVVRQPLVSRNTTHWTSPDDSIVCG